MSTSSQSRFIVVEGLDGSGKSTLARALAERLGARLATTPAPSVRAVRAAVLGGLANSAVARQIFYLATVEAASEAIRREVDAGHSVLLDRYLLSTMVYAAQRGEHLRWPALEARLLPAHVTLFVDLPMNVRKRRLAARGMSDADVETLAPEFDLGVRRKYLEWAGHPVAGRFVRLELTGAESPREVADLAQAVLELTAPASVAVRSSSG